MFFLLLLIMPYLVLLDQLIRLFLLAILGLPLAYAMALGGILGMIIADIPLLGAPIAVMGVLGNFAWLALPLFIILGGLLSHIGVARGVVWFGEATKISHTIIITQTSSTHIKPSQLPSKKRSVMLMVSNPIMSKKPGIRKPNRTKLLSFILAIASFLQRFQGQSSKHSFLYKSEGPARKAPNQQR